MTRWAPSPPCPKTAGGVPYARGGELMLPDCPHSWADHCPRNPRCKWRRCVVPGCRHVEDRNDPDRGYDNPAPTASKPKEKP